MCLYIRIVIVTIVTHRWRRQGGGGGGGGGMALPGVRTVLTTINRRLCPHLCMPLSSYARETFCSYTSVDCEYSGPAFLVLYCCWLVKCFLNFFAKMYVCLDYNYVSICMNLHKQNVYAVASFTHGTECDLRLL